MRLIGTDPYRQDPLGRSFFEDHRVLLRRLVHADGVDHAFDGTHGALLSPSSLRPAMLARSATIPASGPRATSARPVRPARARPSRRSLRLSRSWRARTLR